MSQFTRVTDRQTDRRTDGRTDGRADRIATPKTALAYVRAVKSAFLVQADIIIIILTHDAKSRNFKITQRVKTQAA